MCACMYIYDYKPRPFFPHRERREHCPGPLPGIRVNPQSRETAPLKQHAHNEARAQRTHGGGRPRLLLYFVLGLTRGASGFSYNCFLFFISHIIQLTSRQQSAESRNRAGAEALAVARRPEEASRERTRPPPVSRGSSPCLFLGN